LFSPLISIVIPIYNREYTLHYCIESVLAQEYGRWELLLIDDGSTDHSAEICKSYCEKDEKIKYFHQTNAGAGAARNRGIEEAKGEWITFVDSDDAILPNHLAQLVQHGEDRDCVMVSTCKASFSDGKLQRVKKDENKERENVTLTGNKNIISYLYGDFNPYQYANFACWDKFFKMSVIRQFSISYPVDVPSGQDQVFVARFFIHTEAFAFSNKGTYALVPMGNENIDHLACQLRTPKASFHCQEVNYETLISLYKHTSCESVREYAVNYILDKPFTRIILPYTLWRNRRKVGRQQILEFIRQQMLPIAKEHECELHLLKNERYRAYWKMILNGQEGKLYDQLYQKGLRDYIKNGCRRRWQKILSYFS